MIHAIELTRARFVCEAYTRTHSVESLAHRDLQTWAREARKPRLLFCQSLRRERREAFGEQRIVDWCLDRSNAWRGSRRIARAIWRTRGRRFAPLAVNRYADRAERNAEKRERRERRSQCRSN